MLVGCAVMPPPYPARRDTAMPPADAAPACLPGGSAPPSGSPRGRTTGLIAVERYCTAMAGGRVLKVSGTNEPGEPNGEPTSTGTRPCQATSSHSRGWQMPHRATSSHVQRPYVLVLQARGRRFEPCCAHCFSELEMIAREPNGEPRLLMILALAEARRSLTRHRNTAFVRELIPGGRAWQRIPALDESSRPGRQAPPRPAPRVRRPESRIAWADGPVCTGRSRR